VDPVLGDRGVVAQVGFVDAFDKGYVEACGIGFGRIAHYVGKIGLFVVTFVMVSGSVLWKHTTSL